MGKLNEVLDNLEAEATYSDSNAWVTVSSIEQAEKDIKALVIGLVDEAITGCDGYERSAESIKCQWCGETEYTSNHDKSRLIKKLEEL